MLPKDLQETYSWIISHPGASREEILAGTKLSPDVADRTLAELEDLRLVSSNPHARGYLAHSPHVALSAAVGPLEQEAQTLQERISSLRDSLSSFHGTFRRARSSLDTSLGFEIMNDPDQINDLLAEAAERVQKSLSVCHRDTASTPAQLNRRETDLALEKKILARGVHRRTLYSSRAREDSTSIEIVKELSRYGAEFRTLDHIPTLFLLFDETTAVIKRNDFPLDLGAIIITDPSLVRIFCTYFNAQWEAAENFFDVTDATNPLSPTQRSILFAMTTGVPDEVIARRLSISVRTCRRHIAHILEKLDASSRFQAGVRAAHAGWVNPPSLRFPEESSPLDSDA